MRVCCTTRRGFIIHIVDNFNEVAEFLKFINETSFRIIYYTSEEGLYYEKIYLDNLSSGIYFYSVRNGNTSGTGKIVKR